jgi:hypothetical protein
MAPILDIEGRDFERAKSLLKLANVTYSVPSSNNSDDFVYVPSMKLHVLKQRTLQGKNWFEAHNELQSQGERMMTLPEFIEFLKYTKDNFQEIYKDITELQNPWRAEWVDSYFEKRKDGMYILTYNRAKEEKLDMETLMEDKQIDLESWLDNHTRQGLPNKKIKSGNLYYWAPRENSVARFDAGSSGASLNCDGGPSYGGSILGVRAVRHE